MDQPRLVQVVTEHFRRARIAMDPYSTVELIGRTKADYYLGTHTNWLIVWRALLRYSNLPNNARAAFGRALDQIEREGDDGTP